MHLREDLGKAAFVMLLTSDFLELDLPSATCVIHFLCLSYMLLLFKKVTKIVCSRTAFEFLKIKFFMLDFYIKKLTKINKTIGFPQFAYACVNSQMQQSASPIG